MPEKGAEPGAEREPGEGDEEDEAEQETPEASPHGAAARGAAAVRGRDVVLAILVAADRSHLVCLDDEILLEATDGLARRLGCHLVEVADRDESCHDASFLTRNV